jgi:hypothetical protein
MKKMKGEDFAVVIPPVIQAQIDADPKLAEFVRETNARLRQALDGVDMHDPAAVEAAMRSVGAERLVEVVPTNDGDDDDQAQ